MVMSLSEETLSQYSVEVERDNGISGTISERTLNGYMGNVFKKRMDLVATQARLL
jgi:hypothetical protein